MVLDNRKTDNELDTWNRNVYRPVKNNIIEIDRSRFNSTPRIRDDKPIRAIIRSQIKPFHPETVAPETTPLATIGNSLKYIDFQSAIIPESEKRYHCAVMFDTLNRLACCWNTVNHITEEMLYTVYEMYCWTCPVTGVKHSVDRPYTPLSVEFLRPVHQHGRMVVSNIRPIFYSGWFRGEYRWAGMYSTHRQAVA